MTRKAKRHKNKHITYHIPIKDGNEHRDGKDPHQRQNIGQIPDRGIPIASSVFWSRTTHHTDKLREGRKGGVALVVVVVAVVVVVVLGAAGTDRGSDS